jgi:hypothetical protein
MIDPSHTTMNAINPPMVLTEIDEMDERMIVIPDENILS